MDCWDGPDGEPIIYHGHTLTSKISFRSAIEGIREAAFVAADTPLILSLENHCSRPQQAVMADILTEVCSFLLLLFYYVFVGGLRLIGGLSLLVVARWRLHVGWGLEKKIK